MKVKFVKENCLSGVLKEVENYLNMKENEKK